MFAVDIAIESGFTEEATARIEQAHAEALAAFAIMDGSAS